MQRLYHLSCLCTVSDSSTFVPVKLNFARPFLFLNTTWKTRSYSNITFCPCSLIQSAACLIKHDLFPSQRSSLWTSSNRFQRTRISICLAPTSNTSPLTVTAAVPFRTSWQMQWPQNCWIYQNPHPRTPPLQQELRIYKEFHFKRYSSSVSPFLSQIWNSSVRVLSLLCYGNKTKPFVIFVLFSSPPPLRCFYSYFFL